MLLRFAVRNYLSMAEDQEISLVASTLSGPTDSLITIEGAGLQVLPAAVIYGANASGKTNFVKALAWMRSAILYSHRRGDPSGGIPRKAFALDQEILRSPTAVEADFVVEGVRYTYGYECDSKQFRLEWLYSFPEGKRRRLFERTGNQVEFGSHLKGSKKALVEFMRPNSLFLSTATQNDHEQLTAIVSFFRNVSYNSTVSVSEYAIAGSMKKSSIDERTIKFLSNIGTGVQNYRVRDVKVPDEIKLFSQEISSLAKKHMGDLDFEIEDVEPRVKVELLHKTRDGKECYLSLDRESSGTRRLLLMMNAVFQALDNGTLIIIDELDASLHTQIAEAIVAMFCDPMANKLGAQLIATTHDTNILNSHHLRRDQIWFSEKDLDGKSSIFSLAEIKSRPTDDFERGYLEGRYGAIPFAGNARRLFGVAE